MRKINQFVKAGLLLLVMAGCSSSGNGGKDAEMDRFVSDLMGRMTLQEKLGQLNLPAGNDLVSGAVKNSQLAEAIRAGEVGGFFNVKGVGKIYQLQRMAVEESRLGIPLMVGADVIHGYETIFPIPLALSCSWDTAAVERMARISATEASADGVSWTFSPMVDICRDARWGRVAEGSGEDPYLGALMAGAYVRGYQGDGMKQNNEIMACVKHFALYGASESGRDYNSVDMSRNRMYNVYLRPYKGAVDAGVGSVMSSFNTINGVPATADKWLLTDLLRNEWGFKGFVVTDYNSIGEMKSHGVADVQEASARALNAGTDMDMVTHGFLHTLEASLKAKAVTQERIDEACRRILEAKYKLGLFENPYKYCDTLRAQKELFTEAHRKAAREIATETFVLLKNEGQLLPLQKKGRIALIGPLADAQNNMCGTWSMNCATDRHVTMYDAFRRAVGDRATVAYAKGSNLYYDEQMEQGAVGPRPLVRGNDSQLRAEALRVAASADVIVAALGESAEMSGESASRTEIQLPDAQRDLLKALVATGKPVVLALFTGRPLDLCWESAHVPAILNVWFAGSEAGDAIADVVFGDVSPSGKLTTSFPRAVGQLPLYYNHLNTGRPDADDTSFNRYTSNYIDQSNEPLYPFGYGLSYTTFTYGTLKLSAERLPKGGQLKVTVPVTNTGKYDGVEIVQLYLHDVYAEIARPVKELKAFQRVFLKKGETRKVEFVLDDEDLKYYNSRLEYGYEPGEFEVMVGPDSRNVQRGTFVAE